MRDHELRSVEDILVGELRQLYSTAQDILEVVPDVLIATPSVEAREALSEHMEDTKTRLRRLNQRCAELGIALDSVQSALSPRGNDALERCAKWDPDRTDCRFDSAGNGSSRNRSIRQAAKSSEPSWLYAAR